MMKADKNRNLSRSERKAAYREKTARETNKEAEQRRLLKAERNAVTRKRTIKIILYICLIASVLLVALGYYGKAKTTALIKYIDKDSAITTGCVDKITYRYRGYNKSSSIYYHYYVDGKRFDMHDSDLINIHWHWIFAYGEEAYRGDSLVIKYRRGDPEKHIITEILQDDDRAEQRRALEAERKAADKKSERKILLYIAIPSLAFIVSVEYYRKAREKSLVKYIDADPATTTGYVYKVHDTVSQGYISYYYYVDGKKFDMYYCLNKIKTQCGMEMAYRGDSLVIKYRRGDPEKHIIMEILPPL